MAYVNLGQIIYPVGAIYQSWSSTSPASLFGGQWTQITEKFLYCSNSAGDIGGENAHQLTVSEMPKHSHSLKWGKLISVSNSPASVSTLGDWGDSIGGVNTTGGGLLTTICRLISRAILGDAQANLFIGGGLVWHM